MRGAAQGSGCSGQPLRSRLPPPTHSRATAHAQRKYICASSKDPLRPRAFLSSVSSILPTKFLGFSFFLFPHGVFSPETCAFGVKPLTCTPYRSEGVARRQARRTSPRWWALGEACQRTALLRSGRARPAAAWGCGRLGVAQGGGRASSRGGGLAEPAGQAPAVRLKVRRSALPLRWGALGRRRAP